VADILPFPEITERKWAVFSEDRRYRYELGRRWADGDLLDWVMLNPSTADEDQDDPTIRRCIGFARDWGYAGVRICNLFAAPSTDPAALMNYYAAPWGVDNPEYLAHAEGPVTMCAWGSHRSVDLRVGDVAWIALLRRRPARLMCLGINKDGHPKHPLYVPRSRTPRLWESPVVING
jgi:hypothetical protein